MQLRKYLGHLRIATSLLVLFALLLIVAYPAVLVGLDSVVNPNGAQGSPMTCKGVVVGSSLIAQNVSSPMFFAPRNASASDSGVDPDITPADALSQVPSISNATGIANSSLDYLIQQNINSNEAQSWFLAPEYVNVNTLNLNLIQLYPSIYSAYCAG